MKREPSILETFQQREKQIREESALLDKEMSKKREMYERLQADALGKLEAARAALGKMKSDYHDLESELAAKAKAGLEASAVTAEKVGKGEATLREFFAEGLSGNAIAAKAHDEAAGKLAEATKLIRAKAAEIYQLEFEEAEARQNVIYCATYPGQNQIVRLKEEIKVLEQGVSAVLYGYPQAAADRDRFKINIKLCEGKSISGVIWNSLSYDELLDLRLDPRITDGKRFKALEGLEEVIASAKPGERYYLAMNVGGYGNDPGFVVRCLNEGGDMITTTTTAAPEKK